VSAMRDASLGATFMTRVLQKLPRFTILTPRAARFSRDPIPKTPLGSRPPAIVLLWGTRDARRDKVHERWKG
jgi:hypothetical protein